MLSSHIAQKRAICLGLITLGVVLILMGTAHISEAKSHAPEVQEITLVEPETPCDVCHEETTQVEQASVRVALQTVSARSVSLQQQPSNSAYSSKLNEVEALLYEARQALQDGDANTAQALVDHAQELVKQIEQHARLSDDRHTNPFNVVGVLSQKSAFGLSFSRRVVAVTLRSDRFFSMTESDRVLGVHAEDLYRRAPPSDEASDLNNIHNLTFQSRRLPLLNAQSFFVLTRSWKYTGVDRTPRYFV